MKSTPLNNNFMQVVPGSETCLNGHKIVAKTTDNTPWKCGEPTCEYYQSTPLDDIDDEIRQILELYAVSPRANLSLAIVDLKAMITNKQVEMLKPLFEEAKYQADRAERKDLSSNVDSVLIMIEEELDRLTSTGERSK